MTVDEDKPLSSAQRAVQQLRALIFSGELPAGSDHLESELASRLGMSRTPVREAALILEGQGLVELRPRKGVRISPVSVDDMREIYDVLTELESLSAERAAAAGYGAGGLNVLLETINAMERALDADDLRQWAAADDRFHRELVLLGGNRRIAGIVEMMSDQVKRARDITLLLRPLPTKSNEDHRAVYDAIRCGMPDVARERHRIHRRHARDMLVGLLEKHGLSRL